MNIADPAVPVHALLDGEGRLLGGDTPLLRLNAQAGGAVGAPLAVPQLATLARLARRLGVPIARAVTVADQHTDLELFVRAQAGPDGIRLALGGWREVRAWRPAGTRAELDLLSAGADWRWECDGALRLGFVSIDAGTRHGFDAVGLLGRPLTDLFLFAADEGGDLPVLAAVAERRSFADQPAQLRAGGQAVRVSAVARHDPRGGFAGFAGAVAMAVAPAAQPAMADRFGERLERALRTPLGLIIANADSIHGGSDGPVAPDYAAYAADIASAGRHLMALVDDLADLEAVDRPGFVLPAEPIDLADIARRAAGLLSVRAANARVTIARPGPDETLPARGDFRRTLQIMVNLIGNAVRYSPPGGVVQVTARRKASGARLAVSDAGKGIAAEDQARIFDKFERVDPSEPGGSGLGLYIARRLARAMGGDVTVRSRPGEGARFALTLSPDAPRDEHQ